MLQHLEQNKSCVVKLSDKSQKIELFKTRNSTKRCGLRAVTGKKNMIQTSLAPIGCFYALINYYSQKRMRTYFGTGSIFKHLMKIPTLRKRRV